MTLALEAEAGRKNLRHTMATSIYVLGEALMDCMAQDDGRLLPLMGGSPYNMARAAARRGAQVNYLNALSTDRFGEQLAAQLLEDGVHLISQRSARPTSLAVVQLTHGQASYSFYREGIADRDYTAGQIIAMLGSVQPGIFHTGSLMLVPPEHEKAMEIVMAARDLGWIISLDINLRPELAHEPSAYRDAVQRFLPMAHWLKASEEDLQVLGYQISALTQAPLVAKELRTLGVRRVALTFGSEGAFLDVEGHQSQQTVPKIALIDTVGAGDTFWGNCVAEWALGLNDAASSVSSTLTHAMAAAAINCSRQGCQPPSWAQTEAFIAVA